MADIAERSLCSRFFILKTFTIIHGTLAPYRRFLFDRLSARLATAGWKFRVEFMSKTKVGRPSTWSPAFNPPSYDHVISRNIVPQFGDRAVFLNPGIIWRQIISPPDVVVLGGIDTLTCVLALVFGRAKTKLVWMEANPHTRTQSKWKLCLKKWLLRSADGFIVPGQLAKQEVSLLSGRKLPTLTLPNLVDPEFFMTNVDSGDEEAKTILATAGITPADMVMVWPARLIPCKGILEFLRHWAASRTNGWKIVVLGEGSLRQEIEAFLKANQMGAKVMLIGHHKPTVLAGIYRQSHVFLLPSIQDANPLSVPEAMYAGLPLLVSSLIGNAPEAVEQGLNGIAFDPRDDSQTLSAIADITSWDRNRLREAGRESTRRAAMYWNTEVAMSRFVDELDRTAALVAE